MAAKQSIVAQIAAKPLSHQIGILLGVMVFLGGVYYQFFYSSMDEELVGATRKYERAEQQQKKLRKQEKEWKQMVKDQEALEIKLSTNQVSLPATAALPSFIGHLQRQAAVAGVSFKNFKILKEIAVSGYVKVPIAVNVVGNFHQLLKYFDLLGKTKRIITVENFSITQEKADSDEVLLNASFRATTFRQTDAAAAASKQKAAEANEKNKSLIEKGKDAKAKREAQLNAVSGGDTDKDDGKAAPAKSGMDRLKNPGI